MRKVTKIGASNAPKRRGRPRKVVTTIDELKQKGDPEITHVMDLMHHDRTEVAGKDPNKVYRWVREDRIAERERQGYAKTDDSKLKSYHDGNYWNPEGRDIRHTKGGSILMEIPKDRYELRCKIKEERVEEQSQAMDMQLRSALSQGGSQVLPDNDEFIQELAART